MKNLQTKGHLLPTYAAIGLTLLIGCINLINVQISLVFILGLIIMFVLYLKPRLSLALLIFIAPFSGTQLIAEKIAGVPGLKIMNMALLALLIVFLLSKRHLSIGRLEALFLVCVISILALSVVRSLPYLDVINIYFEEEMGYEKFFVTHIVKPIFYIVPFLIILGYMRNWSDLDFILICFRNAMLFLSVFILSFYMFKITNKTDYEVVRSSFASFFNMHTNGLSDFYIIGYPLVLAWFLYKKTIVNAVNLVLALSCIAILYSRTAYVLVIFSTLLFLVLNHKKKVLPVVLVLGLLATYISPETIVQRSMKGIEERDLQKFSAGRIENIWIPLLKESKEDVARLLIGSGRYAIIHSSSVWKGHAHNMYLNTFLDTGVLGLTFFVTFFLYFARTIKSGIEKMTEGKYRTMLIGVLVSVIAFLFSGMTGRNFFPDITNSYLWILLALGLKMILIFNQENLSLHER